MVAAKPITLHSVITTLLYSLTQILNTQFQHTIINIQFVVHPRRMENGTNRSDLFIAAAIAPACFFPGKGISPKATTQQKRKTAHG